MLGGGTDTFMPFSRALAWNEMQKVSSRIWTLTADSISYDDNHFTKYTSFSKMLSTSLVATSFMVQFVKKDIVFSIIIGNGHSSTSSNPGRDWLHFT